MRLVGFPSVVVSDGAQRALNEGVCTCRRWKECKIDEIKGRVEVSIEACARRFAFGSMHYETPSGGAEELHFHSG